MKQNVIQLLFSVHPIFQFLYQLTSKGYLAIMLNQTDIDSLLEKANETTILELLATLAKQLDMSVC